MKLYPVPVFPFFLFFFFFFFLIDSVHLSGIICFLAFQKYWSLPPVGIEFFGRLYLSEPGTPTALGRPGRRGHPCFFNLGFLVFLLLPRKKNEKL